MDLMLLRVKLVLVLSLFKLQLMELHGLMQIKVSTLMAYIQLMY